MQALRHARFLARFVLAWFVLFVAAASASALVAPQRMELVCSGGSLKLLVKAEQGGPGADGARSLDCPMCLGVDAPLPARPVAAASPQPLGRALQPIPSARLAALVGAPLPARGPPAAA